MLNKPKFMIPSTNMQERTVDMNDSSVFFSCIVDGNEAVSAWQIIIYNLADGQKVFDSDKVVLSTPFFPIDEKNRNVVFSINIKDHLEDTDTFVNRKEAYYWTITFWSTSDIATTSCEEVFYASAKPVVDILYKENNDSGYTTLENDTILQSRTCSFKGDYSQENGVQLKRYGWRLCDIDSGRVLVDTITHNQIYGIADNIVCTYNGFLNNGNYSVELYVETQDGTTLQTEAINFRVAYSTTFLENDVKVVTLDNEPSVMLDWSGAIVIGGKNEGDISFKENYPIIDYSAESPITSVEIPSDSKITFDYGASANLDIDEECYVVLSTQLLSDDDASVFYAGGKNANGDTVYRELSFKNGRFIYTIVSDNQDIIESAYPDRNDDAVLRPNRHTWYIITMSPVLTNDNGEQYSEFTVTESKLVNGLYPSDSLYPKTSLYPTSGVWDKLKQEVE